MIKQLGGVMYTTQILLIIVCGYVLMILFNLLVGASRLPRAASTAMTASIAEAGKRMGSVAKQAEIFAKVSTLLVNRTTLEKDVPRIGAALFLAGAIDYLAQKSQLNDIEYLSVTRAIIKTYGLMTEENAET